jgi:alpha-tubulin suppressor-like RCC1 family protein
VSDYYHDDPTELSEPKSKKLPALLAFILFVIAGGSFLQTTLAANISLNSGGQVEFGQGTSIATACSQGSVLSVIPKSEFVNAAGAGDHYVKSIQISGIPSSCNGKDFNISLYNNTPNSDALAIFGISKSVATVYSNDGTFQQGYQGTGSTVSSTSGGFTITFTSPVALSSNAAKITLQSSEHRDWAEALIAGGQGHTCILLNSSAVKCWGLNDNGQLGNGTFTNSSTPINVSGLSSGVSAISTRYNHTCAVLSSGAVKCWGNNPVGQLGDGTTTRSNTPVNVSGLSSGVSTISTGNNHSCALLRNGGVKCWGDGGKTGDGTDTVRYTPVDVSGLSSGVIAISAAGYHTCAVLSTGAVKCWGSDDNGSLGNGGGAANAPGGAITGLSSGVIAIASGERHNCVLLSSGGVQCWGKNESGQLGNGTTLSSATPVTVSGISSAVAISAAFSTSCALLSSGALKCWGSNGSGQFGDGTITSSTAPVTVSGINSAVTMGNGIYHTCAVLSTSVVKCWGSNGSGQLGDGTTTQRLTPVSVTGIP